MSDNAMFHTTAVPNGVALNDTGGGGTLPPVGLRVAVSITCVLSMLGATLIVLLYALLPRVRTKPALILVHISFMDFLTAAANFAGVVLVSTGNDHGAGCIAQASLAMYGTLSSVMWTSGLAVYVFAVVLSSEQKVSRYMLHCLCLLCYGLPLMMTLWFSLTDKLGPDPIGGPSWCSLILHDSVGRRLPFNTLFGNDMWIYISFIIVMVLFAPMHCYLKYLHYDDSGLEPLPLVSAELKLICVPVVFLVLRIWSLILGVVEVEIGYDIDSMVINVLLYMSGIGDSAQGFANSLIFVFFTPDVRVTALKCCRYVWCEERVIPQPHDRIIVDSNSLTYEESQPVNLNRPVRSILVKN